MSVAIPKRMRALQRDMRGYPIPFIVMRDQNGKPLFAANDVIRQRRAVLEKRCQICGSKLDSVLWLVGGPLSAFVKEGAYIDSPMHHECMEFALQVCPYLAAPNYLGSVSDFAAKAAIQAGAVAAIEETMLPGRPVVFVAVATRRIILLENFHLRPELPYLDMEFWRHGKRITKEEAIPMIRRSPIPEQKGNR